MEKEKEIIENKTYEQEELLLAQLRRLSKESQDSDSQSLLVELSNAMVNIYLALDK